LITHSEEIAFYKGNNWEKQRVNETFNMLTQHIKSVYSKKFFMGVFDSMLVKYGAVMIGYTILGLPVFRMKNKNYGGKGKGDDASLIAKDYIRNSSLLINLAKVNINKLILIYVLFIFIF
jgi:ATP-binding cassette subfamily D (ALD) protein 3